MSNEMAPKSLKHKDDRHIQTRLDYMLIFRSEGKAKIIRTLESWTDSKIAEWYKGIADSKEQGAEPPTEDLWITMSYDQFSLFVYGTIQHDTIKQQVDELVTSKHIERRIHPVYPYGPPQYRLNRELVQKSLDELEIPGNLFDLLPMFVTPRKKRTPQEKYPQGGGKKQGRDPGKIPPGTGETSYPSNNTTKNTENTAKNQGNVGQDREHEQRDATASPPAPVSSEDYHPDFLANRKTDSYSHQPTEGHDDECMGRSSVSGDALRHLHGAQGDSPRTQGDTRQDTSACDAGTDRLPESADGHAHQLAGRDQQTQPTTGQPITAVAAGGGSGYEKPQQQTLTGASQYQPPAGAQRGSRGQGKGKEKTTYKVYFSTEGTAFRTWYEELTGAALDETAANARACNSLGQRASVTYENLKLVVNEIRTNNWVKRERVGVTVQDLASEDKNLRWEKWLKAAQQASPLAPLNIPTREEDPYSVAALIAEQNPGYFAGRS